MYTFKGNVYLLEIHSAILGCEMTHDVLQNNLELGSGWRSEETELNKS